MLDSLWGKGGKGGKGVSLELTIFFQAPYQSHPSRLLKKSLNEKKIYPQSLFVLGRDLTLRREAFQKATQRSEGAFFANAPHTPLVRPPPVPDASPDSAAAPNYRRLP